MLIAFGLFWSGLYAQTVYKIPVVVHIIHYDGSENISEEQIKNGIEILTRNFRKQNPDTLEIVPQFKPLAADMEVEFELAKFDPQGNCTNGINRIRSPFSLTGGHEVKSLIHWPREKYLNIYVTRDAAGLAGHALMPFQADSIPGWDGIVIQGNYFGNIGTSNETRSVVLSHEVGHYLNLFHVWGGNNVPGFYYLPVGQAANCAVGDSVPDTPATIGWSTCNLQANSCDSILDNVQNFMDYAYCARMFTLGQKQRVHDALNSSVAQRNNLWTSSNLTQTGLSVDAPLCRADFYTARRTYCINEEVRFYDASYHDPILWNWNAGNGTQMSGASPVYAYPTSGNFDVSLTVSDGTQQLSVTKPGFLQILENQGRSLPFIEGFEAYEDWSESDFLTECETVNCWEMTDQAFSSGGKSLMISNSVTPSGQLFRITTPRLDLSQTPDPVVFFRYAFARKDTSNTDRLIVRISRDCGKTWLTRKTLSGAQLASVSQNISGNFIPTADQWNEELLSPTPSSYKTNNVIVRFEFYSGGGNNFYLDDINVFDLSTLSEMKNTNPTWGVFPNPAADYFRIEADFSVSDIQIISNSGTMIMDKTGHFSSETVDISDLPAGVYFLRITYKNYIGFRKLVVVR